MNNKYTKKGIARRQEILDFIIEYMKDNGFSPSLREIQEGVGICSMDAIRDHLQILERDGKIKMKPYQPRAISVVGYEFRKVGDKENVNI